MTSQQNLTAFVTESAAARHRGAVLVAAAAIAAPWVLDAYTISLGSYAIVLGLVAVSVHLLTVNAGLPTLGQGAYLIIGGYTAATVSTDLTSNGLIQLLAGTVAAALAAALVGIFATRTRATTFLISTLAVGVLTQTLASRAVPVTGGDAGRTVEPITLWPGTLAVTSIGYLYLYALACAFTLMGVVALLLRSRFGLALRAISGHELRTRASGHPADRLLWLAYIVAGGVAGAAGAILVAVRHTIAPADGGFVVSALALLAALLTTRTPAGAMLGAVIIVAVRDLLAPAVLAGHAAALLGAVFLAAAGRGVAVQVIRRWQRCLTAVLQWGRR
ncbi:branched-chain amino acid ABC transporter permease [Dactylosporangium sp. CA-139066]|uniref:branched-chain amino acid ABC transporter permease n=1 Tax=Dactylosporangium sp. CA-139066 TaxID=3239930 RepID=UPI003D93C90A